MKRNPFFSVISILILLAGLLAMPSQAWAASSTLLPVSYTTTSGSDGGQSFANLTIQDQAGSTKNPNNYVEFQTPGKSSYAGYRSYLVPDTILAASITAIQVKANLLGPKTSKQKWTWSIYNWSNSSWAALGTDSGASWSAWKLFTFNLTGKIAKYVSGTREIRIRLKSNNAADDADLDFESVTLTYTSGTVVPPTATFTASPPTATPPPGTCTHFVATNGNDANNGQTVGTPWKTVQKAAASATPGNVVCVRSGTYNEKVTISVSGTPGYPVTIQNYPGESPILDGIGISVPSADNGMVFIKDKAYIIFKGFEIRNYKTSTKNIVPVGIRITGTSHDIEIRNNKVHNIEHNGTTVNGTDAHGIAVHGTSGTTAITNIIIDGNQLYALKLGSSEALVINGNVDGWQITNNIVRDSNNIAIVAIGFEGTAPSNDQARNGVIRGNDVYNIDSNGNVAYGSERSADGIYVDGGTMIVIEQNKIHAADIGIEIASEHLGKASSYITVRNNFVYNNLEAGISMGGYDSARGSAEHCVIVNNTFYKNASITGAWGSELYIQYDTRNNIIKNNIFYSKNNTPYILSWSTVMTNNVMDNNLFFNTGGAGGTWQWKNVTYTTFASYQSATGNDANGINYSDPLLVNAATGDLHIQTGSPAINTGQTIPEAGSWDIDGQPRVQGSIIDLGADENQ